MAAPNRSAPTRPGRGRHLQAVDPADVDVDVDVDDEAPLLRLLATNRLPTRPQTPDEVAAVDEAMQRRDRAIEELVADGWVHDGIHRSERPGDGTFLIFDHLTRPHPPAATDPAPTGAAADAGQHPLAPTPAGGSTDAWEQAQAAARWAELGITRTDGGR